MKKIFKIITALALLVPSAAFATPVSVNRLTNDHIEPLINTDFIKSQYFTATSTTNSSTLPYASTTAISSGNGWFTGNVGIGSSSPLYRLALQGTAPNFFQVIADGAMADFRFDSFRNSAFTHALIGSLSARGSFASPTHLLVDDAILSLRAGSAITLTNSGDFSIYASENQSNTSTGGYASLKLTPIGSTNVQEYFRWTQSGFGIGTTTPKWMLQIASTSPAFALSDTSAGLNQKHWLQFSQGGSWILATSSDPLNATTTVASANKNGGFEVGSTTNDANCLAAQLCVKDNINNTNVIDLINQGGTSLFKVSSGGTVTAPNANVLAGWTLNNNNTIACSNSGGTCTLSNSGAGPAATTFTVVGAGSVNGTLILKQTTAAGIGGGITMVVGTNGGTTALIATSTGGVFMPNLSAFTAGDSAVCQRAGGEITTNSGVSSCIVSTKAAKHDIKSSETVSSLERIMKLNPVAFEYNENNKPDIGLIAEEVAAVDPRYAQYDPKTFKPKAINWAAITSDLIKTTQDQENRIETLEKLNGIKPEHGSMLPTVFGGAGLLALGAGGVYLSKKKKIS